MSNAYKFNNRDGMFFVSTAVVFWMDVFVRRIYKEIFTDSLVHCIQHKGLLVHAWAKPFSFDNQPEYGDKIRSNYARF